MTKRRLKPDYDDDPAMILPSFPSLRRRTLDTLYPSSRAIRTSNNPEGVCVDKSPKGSVDEHIQSLVDLINRHPSYTTLSSCSGRISLFNPHLRQYHVPEPSEDPVESTGQVQTVDDAEGSDANDNSDRNNSNTKSTSGKGGAGGWLFVSHDEIDDPRQIVTLLDNNQTPDADDDKCTENSALLAFKVEPMLLHVGAASLERGQQLLQVALRTGFRESGLVVTASRVTVAVRSHALALHVPLSSCPGPMRPPNAYLVSLVGEANRRLRENMRRITALYDEIKSSLFQASDDPIPAVDGIGCRAPCSICATHIPDLNLWGHTAVAVPEGPDCWALLAFGGYGDGPQLLKARASNQRSGSVLRLQLSSSGELLSPWESLKPRLESLVTLASLDLDAEVCAFSPREGLASCIVVQPESELTRNGKPPTLIMLFGGRTSPTRPLDELLFCEYWQSSNSVSFLKPTDVRGQLPSPRWGHTVTPLTDDRTCDNARRLAVVFGGRNETEALDSMHVISLVPGTGASKCHLVWEPVVLHGIQSSMRRFHHDAVLLHDRLFVLGGLESTNDLLGLLRETSPFDSSPAMVGWSLDFASNPITATASAVVKADDSCLFQLRRFGHRASVLDFRCNEAIVVLTGGVPLPSRDDDADEDSWQHPVALLRVNLDPEANATVQVLRDVASASREDSFDLGTLVHHDTCVLPSSVGTERDEVMLAVMGGGVPGFGFRPCFAHSYAFTIAYTPTPHKTQEEAVRTNMSAVSTTRAAPTSPKTTRSGAPPATGSSAVAVEVAYVRQHDAKAFKEWLDGREFLDTSYRMAPADPHQAEDAATAAASGSRDAAVAVPMTTEGWEAFDEYQRSHQPEALRTNCLFSVIVGRGTQALHRSTRAYARHPAGAKKPAKRGDDK